MQEVWEAVRRLDSGQDAPFEVVLNGEHVGLSEEDYRRSLGRVDLLYTRTDLFIDMVQEDAYLCGQPMRITLESRNYYLACVYAEKKPGDAYSNRKLRGEVISYLTHDPGEDFNIAAAVTYLIKNTFKAHPIVARKVLGQGRSRVIEGRNVCLIKRRNNG